MLCATMLNLNNTDLIGKFNFRHIRSLFQADSSGDHWGTGITNFTLMRRIATIDCGECDKYRVQISICLLVLVICSVRDIL